MKDKVEKYLSSDFLIKYAESNKPPKGFNKNSLTIKEVVNHFKTDKWPLDINYIKDNIIHEVLGFDLTSYIVLELNKKGVNVFLGSKDNDLVIALDSDKKKKVTKKKPAKRKKK
jgi:hypothetical protein